MDKLTRRCPMAVVPECAIVQNKRFRKSFRRKVRICWCGVKTRAWLETVTFDREKVTVPKVVACTTNKWVQASAQHWPHIYVGLGFVVASVLLLPPLLLPPLLQAQLQVSLS